MDTLDINCSKDYKIIVGSGITKDAGELISEFLPPCKVCIVSDENVAGIYGGKNGTLNDSALGRSLESYGFDICGYTFTPGEKSKSFNTVTSVLDYLSMMHFGRGDVLISLGGGVCGDITGFAASIYMRGIRYIQVPTTLLACVDSSVGGKTGVNLPSGKNMAGSFWHPELVIADTDYFRTLSGDLWRDGLAEILKAGMISDPYILKHIPEIKEPPAGAAASGSGAADSVSGAANTAGAAASVAGADGHLADIIMRALTVKRDIVNADEFDRDVRAKLNFGHTVGHALETCSDNEIPHGHAVAAGMIIETAAAEARGLSSTGNASLISSLLTKLGFPVDELMQRLKDIGPETLARAARADKKAHGDTITIVYPMRPGLCKLDELPISELSDYIAKAI